MLPKIELPLHKQNPSQGKTVLSYAKPVLPLRKRGLKTAKEEVLCFYQSLKVYKRNSTH